MPMTSSAVYYAYSRMWPGPMDTLAAYLVWPAGIIAQTDPTNTALVLFASRGALELALRHRKQLPEPNDGIETWD